MRCVECGAPVAAVTQVCAECGSPAAGQRPVAADPAAGPSDDLETAQAPARTARRPSAWIVRGENGGLLEVDLRPALAPAARWLSAWIRRGQWYFLICLVLFLVLFVIGVAVLNYAAPYGLHRVMGGFIVVGVSGALLFLGLFEAARPSSTTARSCGRWWSFCRPGCSRPSRFSGWRWSAVGAGTGWCSLSTWPPGWRS